MKNVKLEFYVLKSDNGKVQSYNLFSDELIYNETITAVKSYLKKLNKFEYVLDNGNVVHGFEAFTKKLLAIMSTEEHKKEAYAIATVPWGPYNTSIKKIDCLDQLKPNIEMVANYVIRQYKNWIKIQGEEA